MLPQKSKHLVIQTVEMTLLLEYFVYGVHFNRVIEQGSHQIAFLHFMNLRVTFSTTLSFPVIGGLVLITTSH